MRWKTSYRKHENIYSHSFTDCHWRPFLRAEIVKSEYSSFYDLYMYIGGWEIIEHFNTLKKAKDYYKKYAENLLLNLEGGM